MTAGKHRSITTNDNAAGISLPRQICMVKNAASIDRAP
jgi:hypothetical protein